MVQFMNEQVRKLVKVSKIKMVKNKNDYKYLYLLIFKFLPLLAGYTSQTFGDN